MSLALSWAAGEALLRVLDAVLTEVSYIHVGSAKETERGVASIPYFTSAYS